MPPDEPSYRTVLGHFATGVTIITAMDGDEPVGMAGGFLDDEGRPVLFGVYVRPAVRGLQVQAECMAFD